MVRLHRILARLLAVALAGGAVPAAAEPVHPALWKVSDADTTIYLFGTIHALPPGIDWFGGKVESAFDGSDELVSEIAEDDPVKLQALMIQYAALPPGQTLRGKLSHKERARLEAGLVSLGLPRERFDRTRPWYAAVSLTLLPLLRQGFDRANGVEELLDQRARAAKRPHLALETAEEQLQIFAMLPEPVQRRYLATVLHELPTIQAQIDVMIKAWETGDAERLAKLMNSGEDDPALVGPLLTVRNKAWTAWIAERMHKPGTVFLAVGAGHLAGPGGVIELLRARGIASERVR